MKKSIKKILCMAMLFAFVFSTFTVYAKEEDEYEITKDTDFQVEITYGLDGIVKYNAPVPIEITVYNSGKDFSGEIRIIILNEYEENIAYAKDVVLPANTEKSVNMTLQNIGSLSSFYMQIVNEKGKVLYSEKVTTPASQNSQEGIMGILSDDYSALNYFSGITLDVGNYYYGQLAIAKLTEDNFPDTASGLEVCNYILINEYDTSKLSDEQYAALKEWVNQGGVLILGTGSSYQKVLNKFDDSFVTGSVGALSTVTLQVVDENADMMSANTVEANAVNLTVDNAVPVGGVVNETIFYQKTIGSGAVVVSTVNLGMEPIVSWSERKTMAENLMSNIGTSYTAEKLDSGTYYSPHYDWSRNQATSSMAETKSPSTLLYAVIFLIYVICIGPVMYFILKARDKRERMWIVIPVLAAGFTVIVFVSSFFYRITKPFVNEFYIVEYGDDMVKTQLSVGIQSPKAKEYEVTFDPSYTGLQSVEGEYSWEESLYNYSVVIKESADGITLAFEKGEAFTEHYFLMHKTAEKQEQDYILNLTGYTDGFDGTITNNTGYDLENVIVCYNEYYYVADALKNGETLAIQKSDLQYNSYYYSYDIVVGAIGYEPTNMLNKDKIREYMQKENILNYVLDNYCYDHEYNEGIVIGIAMDYEEVGAVNSNVTEYKGAALTKPFNMEFADVTGAYIPDITSIMIASNGDWDEEDGYMWEDGIEATYYLDPAQEISCLKLMSRSNYEDADVYAYNVTTGNWDQIFNGVDTLQNPSLSNYVQYDTITLRYYYQSGNDWGYVPQIAAMGGE